MQEKKKKKIKANKSAQQSQKVSRSTSQQAIKSESQQSCKPAGKLFGQPSQKVSQPASQLASQSATQPARQTASQPASHPARPFCTGLSSGNQVDGLPLGSHHTISQKNDAVEIFQLKKVGCESVFSEALHIKGFIGATE